MSATIWSTVPMNTDGIDSTLQADAVPPTLSYILLGSTLTTLRKL
jgi:hypothetical protein